MLVPTLVPTSVPTSVSMLVCFSPCTHLYALVRTCTHLCSSSALPYQPSTVNRPPTALITQNRGSVCVCCTHTLPNHQPSTHRPYHAEPWPLLCLLYPLLTTNRPPTALITQNRGSSTTEDDQTYVPAPTPLHHLPDSVQQTTVTRPAGA